MNPVTAFSSCKMNQRNANVNDANFMCGKQNLPDVLEVSLTGSTVEIIDACGSLQQCISWLDANEGIVCHEKIAPIQRSGTRNGTQYDQQHTPNSENAQLIDEKCQKTELRYKVEMNGQHSGQTGSDGSYEALESNYQQCKDKHTAGSTGPGNNSKISTIVPRQANGKLCLCPLCYKSFNSFALLKLHTCPVATKNFQCPVCLKTWQNARELRKHQIVNNHFDDTLERKKLSMSLKKAEIMSLCDKCGFALANSGNGGNHQCSGPITNSPVHLKCPECPMYFDRPRKLANHHLNSHYTDGLIGCAYCPKRYNLLKSWVRHQKYHTESRNILCEVCSKSFLHGCELNKHMKSHTEERPFVCEFCTKAFKTGSNLKQHSRVHWKKKPVTVTFT